MSRRRRSVKRKIAADKVYNSLLVSKIINGFMKDGKKSIAAGALYSAAKIVEEKTKKDFLEVLISAVDNIKPKIEVKPRRVGGATYQVPIEVSSRRQNSLAIRWLVQYARTRGEKGITERVANEIIESYEKRSKSVKKREDVHKMAEANRAFAHYRW
ncbi:MAG TPA: 30S ribosomal protein S7 [Deltaproteobacteria bacterium]|nr:30S ribosomal protein S7 [Deltaproteobacteria bacterium]